MPLLLAPTGQQAVDADRVDDGAGQNVGADLATLFEDDDGEVGIELLQTDGGGKAGRTGADDHHVEFHALAFDIAHRPLTGLPYSCILLAHALHSASIHDAKPALEVRT